MEQFLNQGFTKDEIYLLAHDKDRSEELTKALDTNDIDVSERGDRDTMKNLFYFHAEEQRSKIQSLGLSDAEVQQYEKELDWGRIVVVATKTVDLPPVK
ncbi:general stress protein (plasmid) [Priestia megaterium]